MKMPVLIFVAASVLWAAFCVWMQRSVEDHTKNAPCSEFRDGTVGAMPVRCLPWDVR